MAEEYETYKLGDFDLKSGGVIPDAHIAFKTFGDASLPAIIYPSWYSGGKWVLVLPQNIPVEPPLFPSLHLIPFKLIVLKIIC
jgi:hypothetical protein